MADRKVPARTRKAHVGRSAVVQESVLDQPTPIREPGDEVMGSILSRAAFMRPQYMTRSAWQEHVPFAFWIVEAMRPRVVVELGVHTGVSYFAMCQAVERFGIDTRCFAVDTWKGDEHAGFYGDEIFQAVRAQNEKYYSGFSRLVKGTFDDALKHFSDGTIDLLHIDGLHTYEAVEHDFSAWLPKLSKDAVVMMHDTNVREKDFGVFRLFEELRSRYPAFEFAHGHGLGVLGVGSDQRPQLSALFASEKDEADRRMVREIFSRLGRSCTDAFEFEEFARRERDLKKKVEERDAALKKARDQLAAVQTEKAGVDEKISSSRARIERDSAELVRLTAKVSELESAFKKLTDEHAQLQREKSALQEKLSNVEKESQARQAESAQSASELQGLKEQLARQKAGMVTVRQEYEAAQRLKTAIQEKLTRMEASGRGADAEHATEISSLRAKLREHEESFEALEKQYLQAQEEKLATESSLSQLESEIASKEQQYVERTRQLKSLETTLSDREAGFSALQRELASVMDDKRAVEERLALAEAELERSNGQLAAGKSAMSKLTEEHTQVRRHKSLLQDKLTKTEAQMESYVAEITAFRAAEGKMRAEIEQEREKARSLADKFAKLTEEHDVVRRHKAAIQEKLTKIEAHIEKYARDDERLRAAEAEAQRKVSELYQSYNDTEWRRGELAALYEQEQTRTEQLRDELLALRQARADAEWRRGELEALVSQQESVIAKLQEDLSSVRVERGALKISLQDRQSMVAALSRELEGLRARFVELEGQVQDNDLLTQQLASLRNKMSQTESALAQRQLETEQTAEELATAKSDLKKMEIASRGLREHVDLLSEELRNRQRKQSIDDVDYQGLLARYEEQATKVQTLARDIEAARAEAQKATSDRDRLSNENIEIQAKLKQRFDEIATLTKMISDARSDSRGTAGALDAKLKRSTARLKTLQMVAAKEMGKTVISLLNGNQWKLMTSKMRLKRQMALVRKSGLLDEKWYLERYEDVARAGIDPVLHYVEFGAKEGREPNAFLADAGKEF